MEDPIDAPVEEATANPGELRKLSALPEGRVLRLRPGDAVVFEFDNISYEQADEVRHQVERQMPDGVTAMIVSGGKVIGLQRDA